MAKEERETVSRLFREHGIKYTKEKRRLRVAYKIPWGIDFDIHNPAACPKAGTWNGPLECLMAVLDADCKDATGDRVRVQVGNDPSCKHEETTPWEKASFGVIPIYGANCIRCGEFAFRFPPQEEVSPKQMEAAFDEMKRMIG
jgi:hypothetical protein